MRKGSASSANKISLGKYENSVCGCCAEVDRQRRENEDYTRDRSELLGISGVYCDARISAGISARIVWLPQPLPNSCFADFSS